MRTTCFAPDAAKAIAVSRPMPVPYAHSKNEIRVVSTLKSRRDAALGCPEPVGIEIDARNETHSASNNDCLAGMAQPRVLGVDG